MNIAETRKHPRYWILIEEMDSPINMYYYALCVSYSEARLWTFGILVNDGNDENHI